MTALLARHPDRGAFPGAALLRPRRHRPRLAPKSRPAWSAATSAGVTTMRTTRSYRRSWPGRRLL